MPDHANARAQAEAWLAEFDSALGSRDIRAAAALFGEECYWRDSGRIHLEHQDARGRSGNLGDARREPRSHICVELAN